ncbi:IlvN-domain-containing protein [Pseudohyphozyma bogoriensis]|nr:IlvN-domain-containing protein [Pseudohyphozyma bogoriensis]
MPSAKIYYDQDADLTLLEGKTIVFVGYGNQGSAQALNLRDTLGKKVNILIANREDDYALSARREGFEVTSNFEEAGKKADVLFLLVPDQAQPEVFNSRIAPHLEGRHVAVVVASGYNQHFGFLKLPATTSCLMVAPRMIGISVRTRYISGQGYPCFVSVEKDGSSDGSAHALCLAIARGIGATKAGAIASSVKEETMMDLLAEQALWPNIIALFNQAYTVLKEAGCSDEALAYEMYLSGEPAEIFERCASEGFLKQLERHSTVSQYGQLTGVLKIDPKPLKAHFEDILQNRILSGEFAKEFAAIEKDFESSDEDKNPLKKLYAIHEKSDLVEGEKRVKERLPQLLDK